MLTKLIVIRGNSGAGKSTVAEALRKSLPSSVIVSQDTIRREILNVKDVPGNLSIGLLKEIINYSDDKCNFIILEGILKRSIYENMLYELAINFRSRIFFYYIDLSLSDTIIRHQSRGKSVLFGDDSMSRWYLKCDYLTALNEHLFSVEHSLHDILFKIESDVTR